MELRKTTFSTEYYLYYFLKDLHYFKVLINKFEMHIIKQYLLAFVETIHADKDQQIKLDHKKYVYIPSENMAANNLQNQRFIMVRSGDQISQKLAFVRGLKQTKIFRIEEYFAYVIQNLYFMEIPFTKLLNNNEKFDFLMKCSIETFSFNSAVYRRGDTLEYVYFVVEGQIKIYREFHQQVQQVNLLEVGRVFGISELKKSQKFRSFVAKSNLNDTKILCMPIQLIEKWCCQNGMTVEHYLSQIQSQLYSFCNPLVNTKSAFSFAQIKLNPSHQCIKSTERMKIKTLNKKLKDFQENQIHAKSPVFRNFMENNKLVTKIKEMRQLTIKNKFKNFSESDNLEKFQYYNQVWNIQEPVKKEIYRKTAPFRKKRKENMVMPPQKKIGLKRLEKFGSVKKYLCRADESLDFRCDN